MSTVTTGYRRLPADEAEMVRAVRLCGLSHCSDVNAVVDLRAGAGQQLHFILSATPRGGFSGGLAFSECGFALGVIIQSLTQNNAAAELGFFAATSIEAIYVCLQESGLLPACQKQGWDGLLDALQGRSVRSW